MTLCKEEIQISQEVLDEWQNLLNSLAQMSGVPAALIMRLDKDLLEVFLGNQSPENPYPPGEKGKLTGHYCEYVIKHKKQLLVPNALQDPDWKHGPGVKLGMISYIGFPLKWPDGEIFGTLCILDSKENHFDAPAEAHFNHCKDLVETQLDLIFQNGELKKQIEDYQRTGEILENKSKKQEALFNQLSLIVEGTSSHFGKKFFNALVTALAEALDAQYVFVVKFLGDNFDQAETLAFCSKGRIAGNFSYSLAGTPFQKVANKEKCFYPENVQSLFPENKTLKNLQVESFAGVPLLVSNQKVIGLLVAMDCKPIADPQTFETILSIFSNRAQAELIRQNLDATLGKKSKEEQIILDSSPVFIIFKDSKNNILRVNKKVAESLGIQPEDMVGRNSAEFYPNEANGYFQDDLEVMRTGKAKLGIIEPYQLPTGEKRWVQTDKIPIEGDANEIIGILVFFLDVTDRKRAEDELDNYRQHLESLVIQRTQELTLANQQLEKEVLERQQAEASLRKLDRMKSDFLSSAAHELRTPLTSIRGYSELIKLRGFSDPEKAKKFIGYINHEAEKLSILIDDLLDISRIEAGMDIPLRPVKGDLIALVKSQISIFQENHPYWEFELKCDLLSIEVDFDPERIEQVLKNLFSNAVKYSKSGTTITTRIQKISKGVEVCVQNEGVGLNPDEIEKFFDKFFRGGASKGIQGSGLGTAIAKKIIEAHGGGICVKSPHGKEVNVYFSLPVS